jgi:peptide/nickel transport system substrate-binding protein
VLKKKILWLGLSFVLVAALVLSSCAKTNTSATTSKTTAATTSTTAASRTPQYGGTITFGAYLATSDPTTADPTQFNPGAYIFTRPWGERLLDGDFVKYGPRGDNEYDFLNHEYVAPQFMGGLLAESWEVTTNQIIFHIRHGVMFPAIAGEMASRELTADDVVFCLNREINSPVGAGSHPLLKSITATDKYTVDIEQTGYDATWMMSYGYNIFMNIYPPEEVTAGINDWKFANGTGPFMYSDYISGSSMTYVKNPIYWGKTPINGKQYQEPFADKLIIPIIPDESTEMASLRTGKLDLVYPVTHFYSGSISKSDPQLLSKKALDPGNQRIGFNCIDPILKNVKVRQALMIGTDRATICNAVYGDYETDSWPIMFDSPGIYTPVNQLSAADQQLWTYDTTKAKQMIADAGYPNGFNLTILVPTDNQISEDIGAMIQGQWAKIGVTVTLKPEDAVLFMDALHTSGQYQCLSEGGGTGQGLGNFTNNVTLPGPPATWLNDSEWHDPTFDQMYAKAAATIDITQQNALTKALAIYEMEAVPSDPIGAPYDSVYWWPWLQNYYGEWNTGHFCETSLLAALWIDQNMKSTLGY